MTALARRAGAAAESFVAIGPASPAPAGVPVQHLIFTDGACVPNPGPGAWAAIVRIDGRDRVLVGFDADTTNNRMEMMGAIAAIESLRSRANVTVHSDSQYLIRGITSWVHTWRRRGWRTKNGKPVLNQDLWARLFQLTLEHRVGWIWVRGHNGHPENERCDRLAGRHLASMRRRRRDQIIER